jgi:hypothetical protein
MHLGTDQDLNGLQIEVTSFMYPGENGLQQLFYFARDFLLDGLRRFFSWGLRDCSSTGRRRQIFSFTSRNERLSSWNFRNSAISFSALRTETGDGKASLMVLPWAL